MSTMGSRLVVLITGANTGIGFETVKALCGSSQAYTVLLGGRSIKKAEDAMELAKSQFTKTASTVEAVQIDIEDDTSISRLFDDVSTKFGRLDVLVNNAGATFDREHAEGRMTMRDAWNKSWDLNTTSTHIMTHTFIPLLLKSVDPRLLFVTSGTASLTDTENPNIRVNKVPAAGWPKQEAFTAPAYRSAKTGMNMMMREWVRVLKQDGVKLWAIAPGFLATGLGGDSERLKKMGAGDPAVGGNLIKDVVQGKRDDDVGKIVRASGITAW